MKPKVVGEDHFDKMEASDHDVLMALQAHPGWALYAHRLTEKIVDQTTLATNKGDTEWEKGVLYGLREAEENLLEMIDEASGTEQKKAIHRPLALRKEHVE